MPAVVAYAYGTGLTLFCPGLERKPLVLPRLCPAPGPVQQHEVNVGELQLAQRLVQRSSGGAAIEPTRNLGSDKVFIPRQALARQGSADTILVAVCACTRWDLDVRHRQPGASNAQVP